MRNIYIWRVYCKKFENYDQFMNFNFSERNIPIYKELQEVIKKEEKEEKNVIPYIFNNCFISPKKINNYKEFLLKDIEQFKDITKENINKDFDSFYCFLVNKSLSYLYSKDKEKTIKDLNFIYNNTYNKIDFDEEGKRLYNILLNYDLFEKEIITNIYDDELKQDDFEIVLYAFRFIFNINVLNKKCFYNQMIKKNANKFIQENYIPGNFAMINEFLKSYYILEDELKLLKNVGYYVCKDCGYLYQVPSCTFPMNKSMCPNNHPIGGEFHACTKKDIRVFLNEKEDEKLIKSWGHRNDGFEGEDYWINYFVHTTLDEFKKEYVDKNTLKTQKGIILGYSCENFLKDISC